MPNNWLVWSPSNSSLHILHPSLSQECLEVESYLNIENIAFLPVDSSRCLFFLFDFVHILKTTGSIKQTTTVPSLFRHSITYPSRTQQ